MSLLRLRVVIRRSRRWDTERASELRSCEQLALIPVFLGTRHPRNESSANFGSFAMRHWCEIHKYDNRKTTAHMDSGCGLHSLVFLTTTRLFGLGVGSPHIRRIGL